MTPPQLQLIEGNSVRVPLTLTDEKARFLADMQATLRGEKHGVAGPWQYSSSHHPDDPVRGAFLWEAFLKAADNHYYALMNETHLIGGRSHELIEDTKSPILLADFGPGPKQTVINKTLPVKRHFKNVVGYASIDHCLDFVTGSCEVVEQDQPGMPLYGYHVDYLYDEIQLPEGSRKVGLFFGGTIANFEGHPNDGLPGERAIALLRRIREILGEDGTLLITNDTNQDEASVLLSYLHPLQVAFGSNIMHRVKRDLPVYGDFDPEAWRYEPVWHAKSHQLCHTVICERDQSFWLGNERFNIKAGERFILNNSFKYPVAKMKEWAHAAGFGTHRHIMDHENRQALHLMAS